MSAAREPKGFARLTPEARRAVSARGGKAVQAKATAHRFTRESASKAGMASAARRQLDTETLRAMGRKGARQRWANAQANRNPGDDR